MRRLSSFMVASALLSCLVATPAYAADPIDPGIEFEAAETAAIESDSGDVQTTVARFARLTDEAPLLILGPKPLADRSYALFSKTPQVLGFRFARPLEPG